ncbi:DUF1501 domain-containing protein [Undibacterium curvum]|uniref:DUF1501 domain-containing protein n=1 Tax=Undibacterium curvum TaxID=2762294 RepID=A0ABR7A792_9BURK|nr:DUF1501 domain-containing protein [Undibacterium curvum]MBC3932683.1 DUF1501 domain-containing protein [Undibacterium curvum]
MQRRQFLSAIAALSGASGLSWSSQVMAGAANASSQARFLLVFLRGGYDASHFLIPHSSQFYYDSRPNIAIARPGSQPDSGLLLNSEWALHPALRESLYPMFQQGEASFIPFAGTDDLSRSHFETQDSIEMGQALQGSRDFHSGFLNRLSTVLQGSQGVASMAFTDQLPIILQGATSTTNLALKNPSKTSVDERQRAIISEMYGDSGLGAQVNTGFQTRADVIKELQEEMNSANRNAITTKGFALEAQRIAKLMREKYALGFVDVGGWDTHVDQGGARGTLAGKFEELGRGLQSYREEMGSQWKNTTVVVISEFGRTFRENGKRGTDHGHGTVYWVLGGGLNRNQGQGRIAGEQIIPAPGKLFQNRDYPVLNEYRAVFGGLFARMYGLNSKQLDTVFAGVKSKDLSIL